VGDQHTGGQNWHDRLSVIFRSRKNGRDQRKHAGMRENSVAITERLLPIHGATVAMTVRCVAISDQFVAITRLRPRCFRRVSRCSRPPDRCSRSFGHAPAQLVGARVRFVGAPEFFVAQVETAVALACKLIGVRRTNAAVLDKVVPVRDRNSEIPAPESECRVVRSELAERSTTEAVERSACSFAESISPVNRSRSSTIRSRWSTKEWWLSTKQSELVVRVCEGPVQRVVEEIVSRVPTERPRVRPERARVEPAQIPCSLRSLTMKVHGCEMWRSVPSIRRLPY